MTVKELKQLIENVPDDYHVCYEHDKGLEQIRDRPASWVYISNARELITIGSK